MKCAITCTSDCLRDMIGGYVDQLVHRGFRVICETVQRKSGPRQVVFVIVNDMEDLLCLSKTVGYNLVIHTFKEGEVQMEIEIYDDYRE